MGTLGLVSPEGVDVSVLRFFVLEKKNRQISIIIIFKKDELAFKQKLFA